jgi:hypothetical protein
MATRTPKEDTIYVRNRRPNTVVFSHDGIRYSLDRRGSRADSVSLPADATNNSTISRWLKTGILEKITKDSFMQLAARKVDVEPNPYLKRPVRSQSKGELQMGPAEADTTRSLTQITDVGVHKAASPNVEWAGDLMTTEEELEDFIPDIEDQQNYPSKHREEDVARRKQMGY